MLKNPFAPRLLKKVQMSLDFARDREPAERLGDVTHPADGYPGPVRRTSGTPQRVPEWTNPPEADRWAFFSNLLRVAAGRVTYCVTIGSGGPNPS